MCQHCSFSRQEIRGLGGLEQSMFICFRFLLLPVKLVPTDHILHSCTPAAPCCLFICLLLFQFWPLLPRRLGYCSVCLNPLKLSEHLRLWFCPSALERHNNKKQCLLRLRKSSPKIKIHYLLTPISTQTSMNYFLYNKSELGAIKLQNENITS